MTVLLPPFQSIDSVREQSIKGCADNHNRLDQEDLSNPDERTTRQSHQYESVFVNGASCNQKLNLDRFHIISSVSGQGEGGISSEVGQSHSKKATEVAFLSDSSKKQVVGAILPETLKTDARVQREPSVKKSRVFLKLGTSAGSTKEDSTLSSFMSEIMGSKVCPICKTFLSSSNTTLNAHIDQCLSGESTMKWLADPRVIKHKIKPRKLRSLVDIYATAKHCTLEDLDRRNGTNWATNPTPIDQSGELCVKERVEKMPSGGIKDTSHEEGEVCIDTNGKKVMILSKFSEAAPVDGITRAPKGDKGSKLLINKKQKKPCVLKHQQFLKLAPHGKPCSLKPRPTSETRGGSSRNIAVEQPDEKEVELGECPNGQEPIRLDDLGIIRQWVGSKRTGLTKKFLHQDNHQHSGHNLKGLVDERDQSSLSNSYASSNCILNRQQSFKDLVSSHSSKRMESSSNEPGISLYREQPPLKRKREGSYLSCKGIGLVKQCMMLKSHKKLRNVGTTVRDSCNSSLDRAASGSSSLSNKAFEINKTPTRTSDTFVFASKLSCRHMAFSSKATNFTSTRRRHILTNQGTVPKFGADFKRKRSAPTRSQVNSKLESNYDFARTIAHNNEDHPDFSDKQSKMSNFVGKMSTCQTRVLSIRKNSGAKKVYRKEEAPDSSNNSPYKPPYYDHCVGETKEFSPVDSCRSLDNSEDSVDGEESESEDTLALHKHVAIGKTFKECTGGSFKTSSNSLDPEFDDLPSTSGESKSEHCAEVNERHLCGHLVLSPIQPSGIGKQELFSADRVGPVMNGEDIHMEAQLDEQVNYFPEVDPIPIPGPPGSFLPSPSLSDNLQGSSSLTTYKIQFTEVQVDHVERDKSDSPTSAISDISNPTLTISESRSSKSFSIEPLAIQDEIRKGCSGAAPVLQAANVGAEPPNVYPVRINVNFPEETPVSSKPEQLCCCSRKEGVRGVSLKLQESELLRRRTISSLPFPEKYMGNDCYERLGNMNLRSEIFSFSNYPSSGSGMVIHPSRKSASERIDKNFCAEHEFKFSSQRDHYSASPSASTPVLRLMGKNLTVLNNQADVFLQHRQNHSNSMNPQPHLQFSTVTGFSSGSVGSKDYHSYHQEHAQDTVIYSQDPRQDVIGQQFDARFLYQCESYLDGKTPKTPFPASGLNLSKFAADACKTPMEEHEYKGRSEEQRPQNRLQDNSLTNGLEEKIATPVAKCSGVGSTSSRDIIIIDDATDIKADPAIGMCNEEMRKTPVSINRNSVPGASDLSSRFANPFYNNPLEGAGSMYGRRPVVHNASFQLPIWDGTYATPVKWNCNPEGLSLLSPSTLGAPSWSPGHQRPTFHYYPSFL